MKVQDSEYICPCTMIYLPEGSDTVLVVTIGTFLCSKMVVPLDFELNDEKKT